MPIELHVVLPHELIALQAAVLRCFAITEFLPREHALADVDAAIVDDLCLDHFMPGGLQDPAHAVAKEIIAQVAKVQRLVGVG